jgi:chromosomal replication initiator protein
MRTGIPIAPVNYYVFPGLKLETLTRTQRHQLRKSGNRPVHKKILMVVSEFYDIPEEWIGMRNRKREIVWPRQVYCYLCVNNTGMSLKAIGETIGGYDHTTVIHNNQKVKDMIDTDENFLAEVRKIQSKVAEFIK